MFSELNGTCRSSDTSQTTETDSNNSAKSTSSISHLEVCVMGDDLMRLLISYQLFRKDLTHQPSELNNYISVCTYPLFDITFTFDDFTF